MAKENRASSKESTNGLFNKYIWLVNTIYHNGPITFEEINDKWTATDMSGGLDLPKRTFHNQRKAIEELFDINIECNKGNDYTYYIENTGDMKRGGIRNWLLNTFAVNNLINESRSLKKRILFEDIPSGRQFLTPIIEAMKGSYEIEITYQGFFKDEPHTFNIQPYCVKVFKQRWYVIGVSPFYQDIRVYALDRIHELNITDTKFKMPKDFNPQDLFIHHFGIIINEDIDVEKIQIKVFGKQSNYLRALPLHHSQKEIEITEDYSIFEYLLKPTYDFYMDLLSQGDTIEILSPAYVREKMQEIIENMAKRYR